MTRDSLPRETMRLLTKAYEENKQNKLVGDVYGRYTTAINVVQMLADELWELGELRWAAASETRAADLETQGRRHIEAIVERGNVLGMSKDEAAEGELKR